MGELRTQDKRDKLRLLYVKTPAGGTAGGKRLKPLLMDALTVCDAAVNGATPGTFLSHTSEAGGSVGFTELRDFSPAMAKRLIGELLNLYDAVVADASDPVDPTKDEEIYAAMMASLVPIRRSRNDYTGLRVGMGWAAE